MYALAILGAVTSLFTSPTFALTVPPPPVPPPAGEITIEIVTVNGTGCPLGTAAVAVSSDKKSFTVTFSEFTAGVGPEFKVTDARKNCQMNLRVNVPSGFTYGIASADYRGYASLAKTASTVERANYYFQGMPQTQFMEHPVTGDPAADWAGDWHFRDQTDLAAVVYAPCGEKRLFNINTELRANAGRSPKTATSYITMDSADGDFSTTYQFSWLTCPTPPPHVKK